MLVFLFTMYKNSVVQVVCVYRLVFGLFWGKVGMDNSLICLSYIRARVTMCSKCVNLCMYSHAFIIVVTII